MIEKGYGASVRGESHKKNKLPNQDYFLIDNQKYYTLVVVCDGLGSKKYSHYASKRLCKLVKNNVRLCFKNNKLFPTQLINDIQTQYYKAIKPYSIDVSDTTCLFAIVSKKNILIFQVGDGLIALLSDKIEFVSDLEKDFTNETVAFGKSKVKDWQINNIVKSSNKSYKLLLCTDGIAEDLIIEKLDLFINEITQKLNNKICSKKRLKKILLRWPNKYSTDDKTMVLVK